MTTTYVPPASAAGTLSYPNVLRVTFGTTPSIFVPNALASSQLASDIDNLVNNISTVAGVAIGSDPTVAPGALSVTIDFAPLGAVGATSIAQILAQIQAAMSGGLEFLTDTNISRVELVNANNATGAVGAAGRGSSADTVANDQKTQSFADQLAAFFGKVENVAIAGAAVGALFYFGPEIKAGLRSVAAKVKRRV